LEAQNDEQFLQNFGLKNNVDSKKWSILKKSMEPIGNRGYIFGGSKTSNEFEIFYEPFS